MSSLAAARAFDAIADGYDAIFTDSLIGLAQRKQVWRKLDATFRSGDRVLELNCGTGADANHLAELGVSVVALDASAAMVKKAQDKCAKHGGKVSVRQLAIEQLAELQGSGTFDGVVSNFAGLNCVEDMNSVATELARLTRPGGSLVLCIYGTRCMWETGWYSLQGDFQRAFRRRRARASASVAGSPITVFYPSFSAVERAFQPQFTLLETEAVGLFVPPSYLERWARKYPALLGLAGRMDCKLSRWTLLRTLGDHVLLDFRRCEA